jgi:hypothetical protein
MNTESLAQLTPAERITSKPAYLQVRGSENGFYAFQYNPETISDSLQAKYSEVSAAAASSPYLDYNGTSGVTRTFRGLLMDTYGERLSLRPLIEGIKKLMVADIANGQFEPPDVEFHWGSESFKPCKILDFSCVIDLRLGGEPARGTADLTLVTVPDKDPAKVLTQPNQPSQAIALGLISLTQRQQQEGIAVALADIKSGLQKQSPSIRNAIRTGRFEVKISPKGDVVLMTTEGVNLASLGIYDGFRFVKGKVQ